MKNVTIPKLIRIIWRILFSLIVLTIIAFFLWKAEEHYGPKSEGLMKMYVLSGFLLLFWFSIGPLRWILKSNLWRILHKAREEKID
jgi:hypothetical protein